MRSPNSKIERWHKSLKTECIRPSTPLTAADARRLIGDYVEGYNKVRRAFAAKAAFCSSFNSMVNAIAVCLQVSAVECTPTTACVHSESFI